MWREGDRNIDPVEDDLEGAFYARRQHMRWVLVTKLQNIVWAVYDSVSEILANTSKNIGLVTGSKRQQAEWVEQRIAEMRLGPREQSFDTNIVQRFHMLFENRLDLFCLFGREAKLAL